MTVMDPNHAPCRRRRDDGRDHVRGNITMDSLKNPPHEEAFRGSWFPQATSP
jgi:hypothetical protein